MLKNWQLPESFSRLRQLRGKSAHGARAGVRQYIRVLQLLAEHPLERVRQAVEVCVRRCELQMRRSRIAAEVRVLSSSSEPGRSPVTPLCPGSTRFRSPIWAALIAFLPKETLKMSDNRNLLLRANSEANWRLPAMVAEFGEVGAREASRRERELRAVPAAADGVGGGGALRQRGAGSACDFARPVSPSSRTSTHSTSRRCQR